MLGEELCCKHFSFIKTFVVNNEIYCPDSQLAVLSHQGAPRAFLWTIDVFKKGAK